MFNVKKFKSNTLAVVITDTKFNYSRESGITYKYPKTYSAFELLEQAKTHTSDQIKASIRKDLDVIFKSEFQKKMMLKDLDDPKITFQLCCYYTSSWIQGEYYAHEYDKWAFGRIRKIEYSNGNTAYQIECLDKTLSVMDGVWDDPSNNGCGDRFEQNSSFKE
jgi:hypothetical protein